MESTSRNLKVRSGKLTGNKHVNSRHITAVCHDCGFSGINVFIHIFVTVENTLLESPQPRQAPIR
ncbi:hypothetical protein, partial [Flavobacterium sp. GP15]|uniref:hypothetical protein n=1 Tax=Flavobacterium sp. GP15 TaxID=2758567 RepID=UPI001CB72714